MNAAEIKTQTARISQYRQFEERAGEIRAALAAMKEPKVLTSGPFTGNTRESRDVERLDIHFSPTLGGSPAVNISLRYLNVSASALGRWLETELEKQLENVQADMAKL